LVDIKAHLDSSLNVTFIGYFYFAVFRLDF